MADCLSARLIFAAAMARMGGKLWRFCWRLRMLIQVQPILGTRDVERAIEFYVEKLGFQIAFRDGSVPTNYAGMRRGEVEIHVQFQFEHEMQTTRLRFFVENADALYAEYVQKKLAIEGGMRDTPWGTREFALYDPDGNALTFYQPLKVTA
jgi:catechol 2,3-dioxygenase-like lactoylglutathione lyase family enzyme